MDAFVQAGFGDPLGSETLAALKRFGYTGVRLEASAPGLVEEVLAADLKPFALLKDPGWLIYVPPGIDVEYAPCEPPEPDLSMSPAQYAIAIGSMLKACARRGCPLWVGAISNLNKRGLTFLKELLDYCTPLPPFSISVHRYPPGGSWATAHRGFHDRKAEVARLRELIDGRAFGVSEFGFHTARRPASRWWRRLFGMGERWSDVDVEILATKEWKFWQNEGASFATIYQINDGTYESADGRYGLRTNGGEWKPVAYSWRKAQIG